MEPVSTDAWDVVRVLLLVVAGVLASLVGIIVGVYLASWKAGHNPVHRHVFMISISFSLALVYISFDQWVRIDEDVTWRLPVAAGSLLTGVYAIYDLWRRHMGAVSRFVTRQIRRGFEWW
jgi:hypothetical protein